MCGQGFARVAAVTARAVVGRFVPVVAVAVVAVVAGGCGSPSAPPAPTAPPASPPPASQPGTGALPANAPDVIKLPDGFAPEGIAVGQGTTAYVSNRENGAIYRIDLATGHGGQLAPPSGRGMQGMKVRDGKIYAAGRGAGDARVIDANTGRQLASIPLVQRPTEDNNLINDDLLTDDAWWLTDSRNPVLYRIALKPGGALPTPADVRKVPLTGDYHQQKGVNANGIAPAPDGAGLLVVQSNTGTLLRVDPKTGNARKVDLGGETLDDGDGLLLDGQTLYVAQNDPNKLVVIQLDRAATKGTVTRRVADPRFDNPSTIAAYGGRLYLPNARFNADPTPTTAYTVISIPLPR